MSAQSNPHDSVFRRILGEPANAASQLRAVVGESPPEELHKLVAQLGPEAEEAYMTTAEMLRAEGEARGRAKSLVEMLTLKFGPLPRSAVDTVNAATVDQLKAWMVRVLTAETLDDVLA